MDRLKVCVEYKNRLVHGFSAICMIILPVSVLLKRDPFDGNERPVPSAAQQPVGRAVKMSFVESHKGEYPNETIHHVALHCAGGLRACITFCSPAGITGW